MKILSFQNTFQETEIRNRFIDPFFTALVNISDKTRHNKMVSLVDQMLSTQKSLQTVQTDQEKAILTRQTDMLDSQIDKLVYELYGLTDEEIKVVEGNRE